MAAKPEPILVIIREVRTVIVGGKYIFREEHTIRRAAK
jgi:hypothetical protein